MGAIISSAACCAGEAACCLSCMCCSKIFSAMCSCGGGDGSPQPSEGRKRSVMMVMFSLILSLLLQFLVIPNAYWDKLDFAWDCKQESDDVDVQQSCRANSAVFRVSMVAALFFLMNGLASAASPGFNSKYWGAKIAAYLLMLLAAMFTPSAVFTGYLNLARIGAAIFVCLQQIILIDLAYDWNDRWVANADRDEKDLMGSGDSWLKAILTVAATILITAYTALGFLFHFFGGCGTNDAFLWITLVLTLLAIGFQLTGDEGSVLTSAVMTIYSVYLCYSAVSNNPDESCNPTIGSDNPLSVVLGIVCIVASMVWTTYSYANSMTDMLAEGTSGGTAALIEQGEAPSTKPIAGVVTSDKYGSTDGGERRSNSGGAAHEAVRDSVGGDFDNGQAWKLNLVLVLISMWMPMVLTDWGSINVGGGVVSKPSAGETAMWMIIVAQWVALALYIWTLVAPKIFPDRDFS